MTLQKNKSENEAELKIKLSPADMEKVFKALTGLKGTSDVSHKFRPRTYYDTPDMDFYKNKLSLRVQYKPGKKGKLGCYEQTVKLELEPDSPLGKGVMLRKECKDSIISSTPSLSAVTDSDARKALKPFKGKKLVPIFTAAIERRSFDWKLNDNGKKGQVEVAFDAGYLILEGGLAQQAFSEIEIEIKQGSAEFIELVKNKILKIAPSAKIQPLSKADQGSRLYLKHKK